MFLSSRASSITCWPSLILRPAFSSSNIIGGSMMSTPTGILWTPASLSSDANSLAWRSISPKARLKVRRRPMMLALQPPGWRQGVQGVGWPAAARSTQLVVQGGGAEVQRDRGAVAGEQRPAAELVALPLADLGRGNVAGVIDVEGEQRPELGFFQRLLDAAQPLSVQPAVIDPFLE